ITKNGKCVAKLSQFQEDDEDMVKEYALQYGASKRVTYEAYLQLVEDTDERYELIDGQIYYLAAPRFKHQVAVNEINGHFYNWFKGKTCRPLSSPFDVKLFNRAEKFEDDPNVVQPDIIVMCDEEKVSKDGKYEGIPTLVVEVLSKSTKSKDMVKKLHLYMHSNVKEYWLVDPEREFIQRYHFEDRELVDNVMFTKGMTIHSMVFEGLTVSVDEVFNW
ncbi:MAG: Uma2 family endonuclease, partial [Vallitaleaceae bacterium]|nr:Uma2 family endonuclease [Vallitaleaceae bacterium]